MCYAQVLGTKVKDLVLTFKWGKEVKKTHQRNSVYYGFNKENPSYDRILRANPWRSRGYKDHATLPLSF